MTWELYNWIFSNITFIDDRYFHRRVTTGKNNILPQTTYMVYLLFLIYIIIYSSYNQLIYVDYGIDKTVTYCINLYFLKIYISSYNRHVLIELRSTGFEFSYYTKNLSATQNCIYLRTSNKGCVLALQYFNLTIRVIYILYFKGVHFSDTIFGGYIYLNEKIQGIVSPYFHFPAYFGHYNSNEKIYLFKIYVCSTKLSMR